MLVDLSLAIDNDRKVSVVLKFIHTECVILEATMVVGLVVYVVEADDSVFELLIFVVVISLIATASQDRPQDEQRKSNQHKDRVLQHVDQQKDVDFVANRAVNVEYECLGIRALRRRSGHEGRFIISLVGLNQEDGVAEDNCLEHPFNKSGYLEAAIAAKVFQAAVTHRVVDTVETAEAAGDTLDLAFKAQVDEEIVVHQVKNGEQGTDGHQDHQLLGGDRCC